MWYLEWHIAGIGWSGEPRIRRLWPVPSRMRHQPRDPLRE